MSGIFSVGFCEQGVVLDFRNVDTSQPCVLSEGVAVRVAELLMKTAEMVREQKHADAAKKRAELEAIFKSPA